VSIEYLVISHYSRMREEDWHIANTGRVKFHLIKGIRSPLTCDVLLNDERRWRNARGIKEGISAIAWRKR